MATRHPLHTGYHPGIHRPATIRPPWDPCSFPPLLVDIDGLGSVGYRCNMVDIGHSVLIQVEKSRDNGHPVRKVMVIQAYPSLSVILVHEVLLCSLNR